MKNFTIKERQEVYEHLLTLDCPDLLAALIAQRVNKPYSVNEKSLGSWIIDGFTWENTPEGFLFWYELHTEVCELTSDFESPTEVDFVDTEINTAHIEIIPTISDTYPTYGVFEATPKVESLTTWQKIKLFFGKWSYKV